MYLLFSESHPYSTKPYYSQCKEKQNESQPFRSTVNFGKRIEKLHGVVNSYTIAITATKFLFNVLNLF